jgi:hypothetical protein
MLPPHAGSIQRGGRRRLSPKPVAHAACAPTPHCGRARDAVAHLVHDALEAEHLWSVEIEWVGLSVQPACACRGTAGQRPRGDRSRIEHVGCGATGAWIAG